MRNAFLGFVCLFLIAQSVFSQRQMENLGRGLIAVQNQGTSEGVYVNWRITGQEWYEASYNLYRDGTKINDQPITGASNYTDKEGTLSSKYQVAAIINGQEQEKTGSVGVLPDNFMEIELKEIPKITGVPESCYNAYTINDITAADLDGDGEYELLIKRVNIDFDSSKPFQNEYYSLIDAYKRYDNEDGLPEWRFMWRIDVGPNIFNDVEINVIAFDFDGDGKAEVVMRTSEGTIDGEGKVIGPTTNDLSNYTGKVTNYRDKIDTPGEGWFETAGPEYLSLFDGVTGKELDRVDHIARQPLSQWGPKDKQKTGQLAHRSTKYFYGAPYLDGQKPSLFVSRGIYYRIKMATYDIIDKKFVSKWTFDSGDGGAYSSQGNHNYVIADVDNDGCDEIVYGQMTIDHDGSRLYSTQLGHGDAIHVGNFDPYRKGIEVFGCLEESPVWGTTFRSAETGEILHHYNHGRDCGRCMAANITNDYKGSLLWPSDGGAYSASERMSVPLPSGYSSNFRIYWDGDLLEELVDHSWNQSLGKGEGIIHKAIDGSFQNIFHAEGYYSCNYTKGTPCLQADLFGDWREEVIWRSDDDTKIRIYFTTDSTEHRIYTLMHDMQYRQAIAWQMCGYNQPPHPSFFLGEVENIMVPPPPVMSNDKVVFKSGTIWDTSSSNWEKNGQQTTYADAETVLFDCSIKDALTTISLNQTVAPENVTVNSIYDYELNVSSEAKMTGKMNLIKQGSGTFTLNGVHDYTGKTEIWDGRLAIDGELQNSEVWAGFFAELEATGKLGKSLTMRYASELYPGGKEKTGTLYITEDVSLEENNIIEFDLDGSNEQEKCDKIIIEGDFTFGEGITFRFNSLELLSEGEYTFMELKENAEFDLTNIQITGLDDYEYTIELVNQKLVLKITSVVNIEEKKFNSLSIYPNPAENYIIVDGHSNILLNITVTDITGKELLNLNQINSGDKVDISILPKGIYIVKAEYNGNTLIDKILKK